MPEAEQATQPETPLPSLPVMAFVVLSEMLHKEAAKKGAPWTPPQLAAAIRAQYLRIVRKSDEVAKTAKDQKLPHPHPRGKEQ